MISSEATGEAQAYFGWRVVGAAFVLAVFGWGIGFYGPSVFLQTLHDERGWPIALVSAAITAHFLFSALFVAYLPEAYARWGLTRITQAGIFCTATGAMLWGSAAAAWELFPIAAVSGASSAATTGAAINAIVAPWFDKQRPKALSMAFNGASIGGLMFTPLWAVAIGRFGFAPTAFFVGIAMLAIMWPVVDADGAALAVSLLTVCAVLGRSLFRRLLRDDNRRQVAALNFLVQAAGTTVLALASSTPALVSGCLLFGLGVGNLVSLPPLMMQKEFAAADVGKAAALMVAINQAVFAFAPAVLAPSATSRAGIFGSFGLAAAIQFASAAIILIRRL